MNRILSVPQQFRIRVHIAALTMACMGLVAALLIGLGWVATTRQLVQDAGERAVRDTLLLREQIRLQLIPAQGALRQIGAGRLPLAPDEATRLQVLNVLLGELRANPLEAAIYVAYPNGDFLLGRPLRLASIRQRLNVPESAVYLVQTISHQPDGRSVGRFHFLGEDGRLQQSQERADYQFDPRTRPWYALAREHPGTAQLSNPYRFATTQRLGVTLSQQATSGDAVVGMWIQLVNATQ